MPDSGPLKPTLADLRSEIDRIDAAMHQLLIERGRIIDQLIEIKAQQGGGSAFRPAREAAMMRAIVERHRGLLPLDTVEGIWRIIISTFTYMQAPYSVHVDVSRGDAAMRDSARFHFGFTVPCVPHLSAADVIQAVAGSTGDLGMFAVDGGPRADPPHAAGGAQDHRQAAIRGAVRPSRRDAGFRHFPAPGRPRRPRRGARGDQPRSMAAGLHFCLAWRWSGNCRLRGSLDGAQSACRPAGRS